MPDHVHWLVELKDKTLGELMCRIKSRSSVSINRLAKTSQEEDVKDIARYIIKKPIRARLAARIGDYPLWDACWM